MKKLAIVVLLVLSACRRQVATSGVASNEPGAATPREALDRFLASAKSQDLQAMSLIWGSKSGPARSSISREDLEQREVIMMKCLKHDRFAILTETAAAGGERVFTVELRYKDLTRTTNFTATLGPSNRWYLRQYEPDPLQRICTAA